MAKGFAGAIGGTQQQQAPQHDANPQQALQQVTQLLRLVSGIHNQATFTVAKQQLEQMGQKMDTSHYDKAEVEHSKKMLVKVIEHLQGQIPQNTPPAAPQNASGGMAGALAQSQAPTPQEG